MIVLCPVPGLVRRRCPAAHRNPLPRRIRTVNPLTMGLVQQSPLNGFTVLSIAHTVPSVQTILSKGNYHLEPIRPTKNEFRYGVLFLILTKLVENFYDYR